MDIEKFLGMSIPLRSGILFLIIASILFTHWLYINVILKLSLIQKIALSYALGVFILISGLLMRPRGAYRWFSETLLGGSIAILAIVSIVSYSMGCSAK